MLSPFYGGSEHNETGQLGLRLIFGQLLHATPGSAMEIVDLLLPFEEFSFACFAVYLVGSFPNVLAH